MLHPRAGFILFSPNTPVNQRLTFPIWFLTVQAKNLGMRLPKCQSPLSTLPSSFLCQTNWTRRTSRMSQMTSATPLSTTSRPRAASSTSWGKMLVTWGWMIPWLMQPPNCHYSLQKKRMMCFSNTSRTCRRSIGLSLKDLRLSRIIIWTRLRRILRKLLNPNLSLTNLLQAVNRQCLEMKYWQKVRTSSQRTQLTLSDHWMNW